MSRQCPMIEKCPVPKYLDEEGWHLMLDRYCRGSFLRCSRYELRRKNQPVPELMMPWDGITEIEKG